MKKLLVISLTALALSIPAAYAADGKAIYEEQCAKCHGTDGKGDTKMGKKLGAKDYSDPKVQADLKDDKALKSVKEGLKDGDKTLMKANEKLSEDDIKAVIAYLRTLKK